MLCRPVQEEDPADHLIGVGPCPGPAHLIPIQLIKHALQRQKQNGVSYSMDKWADQLAGALPNLSIRNSASLCIYL